MGSDVMARVVHRHTITPILIHVANESQRHTHQAHTDGGLLKVFRHLDRALIDIITQYNRLKEMNNFKHTTIKDIKHTTINIHQ
jgi:hypothetical protein